MNITLTPTDFAALSPLLVLLVGALLLLLVETFADGAAKRYSALLTLAILAAALLATLWAPISTSPQLTPWLRFDGLHTFFTLFFLSIGIACTLLAESFFQGREASRGEYYFLLLSATFGLILIGASADFLTLFLGLETLSISLYILCAYMKKWDVSSEAALKYFLLGALGAAFLLYGIALLYGATGTTHFVGLLKGYKALSSSASQALFLSGIALVTLGFAFKAAIVPFHVWAPDVYDGAPNPVTAFLAVGTKAGAFAAFIRVFLEALSLMDPLWREGVTWLAYPTLIYANLVALRQTQLRRFFAYSGISHAGFLLIPLASGGPDALSSMLFYLIVYSLATLGCFAALAFLDRRVEGVVLQDLHGLGQRSPFLAGVLTLCLLTLAGIPPTAGFFAKFYIFQVAFGAGYYGPVIVGLLTSVLSAYYYLRILSVMLADPPETEEGVPQSWSATTVAGATFLALGILSVDPSRLLAFLASLHTTH